MAKCSICNSRKGKRKCQETDSLVCSLCCGLSRDAEKCAGCSFYKEVSNEKNYRDVPFYSLPQMADSFWLQDIAHAIESIFCQFDSESEKFTDNTASRLLELAFEKYHFNASELTVSDPDIRRQFDEMTRIIQRDLKTTPQEEIVKVMGSIYRSIKRRTSGGKEYLKFIHEYVGARIGPGARALRV